MKRNLFKDILLLSFTRMVVILSTLLQGMILVRALTKGEYAMYAQVLIPINLITAIFSFSLPSSVNYFAAKINDAIKKLEFISKLLTLLLIFACSGSLLLFLFRVPISNYLNSDILTLLTIALLLPIFRILARAYDNIFIVYGKTKKVAIRKTLLALFQIVTVSIVWLLSLNILNFFVIVTIYEGIMFIYLMYTINKDIGRTKPSLFKKEEFKSVLSYVFPLAMASLVGTINLQIDKIFVNHFYGTERFAEYAVVAKELPITVIATSVSAIIIPQISRYLNLKEYNNVTKLWRNSVELSFLSTSWIIGILIVCSYESVKFLYSDKYINGVPVFIIFAIIMMFRIVYFGMILNGSGNSRKIFISSIVSLITNIVFLFILQPVIGYYAAVVSTLLSVMVMNFMQLYFSKNVLNVKLYELIPWANIIRIIFINIAIGILLYYFKELLYDQFKIHYFIVLIIVSFTWFVLFALVYYRRFLILKNNYLLDNN